MTVRDGVARLQSGVCLAHPRTCRADGRGKGALKSYYSRVSALLRTHTCGELRADQIGQEVTLCGWIDTCRDHGGTLFIDLRDRYGKTQIVFAPEGEAANLEAGRRLRSEDVVSISGKVAPRPAGTENADLATGQIEVRVRRVEVLNKSKVPPMKPSAKEQPSEDLRLKYRFLDLRRPEMQRTLILRHRMVKLIRDYFDERRFIDIETPMLGRSTPESPRLSRAQPGPTETIYALPQSPQLYKRSDDRRLRPLRADRRCFRDEDLRADRQPEFTQLDLEMAFVDANDVIGVIDGLMARLARELLGIELSLPLPRMTYDEAMERFGHDAPDLRFGMELVDVSDLAATADFRVFRETVASGGKVRGLNAKNAADRYSRKGIDELTGYVTGDFGGKGLAWFKVGDERRLASPIAKDSPTRRWRESPSGCRPAGRPAPADCRQVESPARRQRAPPPPRRGRSYQPGQMHFSWVVEFPMFEYDREEACWAAMHHPFTSPRPQDRAMLAGEPEKCRAQAYDLVINGFEAGGGTIRIHDQKLQSQVFRLLGIDEQTAATRFGFLLDALQYGAPAHGRHRLGLDRLVMLFGGLDNIRDCIAFPKTGDRHIDRRGQVDGNQCGNWA